MTSPPDTPPEAAGLPAPRVVRPLSEPPCAGRVLVIAPHPDDESVGPGGVLAAHARAGDALHALFVTTGVHGDPQRVQDPAAYVELRRAEARAAAAVLGIGETRFWDFPDGCVVTQADLDHVAAQLARLLSELAPDVVYAPHAGECHSDHHFVARAAIQAHRQAGRASRLLGYEVWSPLEPDFVVDVTSTYALKREAIRCYPSQLEHTDILGAIEGLNRYRAILLPQSDAGGSSRAEAFLEVT